MFACQYDQRFSYCLYVPESYDEDGDATYPLAVIVHGTTRTAQEYRDRFVDFAERAQCVIMVPLFPCGINEPRELNKYKFFDTTASASTVCCWRWSTRFWPSTAYMPIDFSCTAFLVAATSRTAASICI
jgi:hypothetical protein